jgi:hypothetical protein
MPESLPLSHRPRRNRHVMAMKEERVLTLRTHKAPDCCRRLWRYFGGQYLLGQSGAMSRCD